MKTMEKYDVVVIGGGPAGLAAAVSARKNGAESVLVIERDPYMGGVLNQCVHDGFGLQYFGKSLTGPEYAALFLKKAGEAGAELLCDAMVTGLSPDRVITVVTNQGVRVIKARAVVLAMGCRERTRGAISIPGTRPAGVFTAGVAQYLMNLRNIRIGSEAVILGSGDIGLIMARRLTLEGIHVQCVLEKMPYCNGLPRNVVQCLDDFGIPMYLSETVTDIIGKKHIEKVYTAKVGADGAFIEGTGREFNCDLLLLSVGLIPENELSESCGIALSPVTNGAVVNNHLETSVPGIFACGNALHVHDLVDGVSEEAENAGKWAARYEEKPGAEAIEVRAGEGVRYVLPQRILPETKSVLRFRVKEPARNVRVTARIGGRTIYERKERSVCPSVMLSLETPVIADSGNETLEVRVSSD